MDRPLIVLCFQHGIGPLPLIVDQVGHGLHNGFREGMVLGCVFEVCFEGLPALMLGCGVVGQLGNQLEGFHLCGVREGFRYGCLYLLLYVFFREGVGGCFAPCYGRFVQALFTQILLCWVWRDLAGS